MKTKPKKPAARLRELKAQHGLTSAELAQVAMVSPKTVESWLARDGAANHRRVRANVLCFIELMLPAYLQSRGDKP